MPSGTTNPHIYPLPVQLITPTKSKIRKDSLLPCPNSRVSALSWERIKGDVYLRNSKANSLTPRLTWKAKLMQHCRIYPEHKK